MSPSISSDPFQSGEVSPSPFASHFDFEPVVKAAELSPPLNTIGSSTFQPDDSTHYVYYSPGGQSYLSPESNLKYFKNWLNSGQADTPEIFSTIQMIAGQTTFDILPILSIFLTSPRPLLREAGIRGLMSYLDSHQSRKALELLKNASETEREPEIRRLARESFEVHTL